MRTLRDLFLQTAERSAYWNTWICLAASAERNKRGHNKSQTNHALHIAPFDSIRYSETLRVWHGGKESVFIQRLAHSAKKQKALAEIVPIDSMKDAQEQTPKKRLAPGLKKPHRQSLDQLQHPFVFSRRVAALFPRFE